MIWLSFDFAVLRHIVLFDLHIFVVQVRRLLSMMEPFPGCCLFWIHRGREKKNCQTTTVSHFHMYSHPGCLIINCSRTRATKCFSVGWVCFVQRICPFLHSPSILPTLGGCSTSSHDPEQRIDVVGLDGVPTGRYQLVLGFTDWEEDGTATHRLTRPVSHTWQHTQQSMWIFHQRQDKDSFLFHLKLLGWHSKSTYAAVSSDLLTSESTSPLYGLVDRFEAGQ